MTDDLDISYTVLSRHYAGRVRRSRSRIKVEGHRKKPQRQRNKTRMLVTVASPSAVVELFAIKVRRQKPMPKLVGRYQRRFRALPAIAAAHLRYQSTPEVNIFIVTLSVAGTAALSSYKPLKLIRTVITRIIIIRRRRRTPWSVRWAAYAMQRA